MSQGNDFNYSAAADAGTAGSEEVWFVAVASDDIKQMNVDQLDEAFRLGIVTEATAVWTEGMEAWQPLGQVLGGDSEEEAPAPAAPAAAASPVSGATANGGFGAVTLQSVQHSYAPGPLSVAPVTSSLAPSAHTAHGLGHNVTPGSLSLDEDVPAPPARRFRPERWALAAAAIVAVGVAVYNNFSSSVASAGTQAPAPTALAARPYDGADGADKDGVEKGSALEAKGSEATTVPAKASDGVEDSSVVGAAKGAAAVAGAAAAASLTSDDESEKKGADKKAADKDSLKGSFSKAFNGKKASEPRARATRASKVKPRKAASRATTKARAKSKKPSVTRSQSAFDPLNDSLP